MIRILIALLPVLFISFSEAQEVTAILKNYKKDFAIDSRTAFGGRIYYNCQSVESDITRLLEKMGAESVRVRCYGGMDEFAPPITWEASVDLSFSALKVVENSDEGKPVALYPVSIRVFDNCHLLSQVFKRVQSSFEISGLKGPSPCTSSGTNPFTVKFNTVKFAEEM